MRIQEGRLAGMEDFSCRDFRHSGGSWPVYEKGAGPGVIILHEVPGITPEVARFARRVADAGFNVVLPSLFGTPGRPITPGYAARQIVRACVRREFAVLAAGRSSPITDTLRELCREVHTRQGGPGVGVLGMCLTGNFALALMADPSVMAPVLSQPSLPFALTPSRRAGLHLSAEARAEARRRIEEEGLRLLGLRFTGDLMCPAARFDALREAFGAGFEAVEIDSGLFNEHGVPPLAHSVLTNDLVDVEGHPTRAALQRVLSFFEEQLRPSSAA